MELPTLEEAGCLLPRNGWQINLAKLLRMIISRSYRDVVRETAVGQTLTKHLSTDRAYNFADIIGVQAKETSNWIEDRYIVLTFVESFWICLYGVLTQ